MVAPDGNPLGSPVRIDLDLTGSTARRDGLLRTAITQLLDVAQANGCKSITIENLNFAKSAGRETVGGGKAFRRTVSNMPTDRGPNCYVAVGSLGGPNLVCK